MKIKSYQVYNNGEGDVIMVDGSQTKPDARRLLGIGSVECDIEVNSADELERLRGELCDKYREHSGVDDVTVLFRVVG